MLSVHPQELQHPCYVFPFRPPTTAYTSDLMVAPGLRMSGGQAPLPNQGGTAQQAQSPDSTTIAQALEIARESPDGARDPTVSGILETALAHIWVKVQAQPNYYIMSRDEFAVFNFFQQRFVGNELAIAARRRYWDHSGA